MSKDSIDVRVGTGPDGTPQLQLDGKPNASAAIQACEAFFDSLATLVQEDAMAAVALLYMAGERMARLIVGVEKLGIKMEVNRDE